MNNWYYWAGPDLTDNDADGVHTLQDVNDAAWDRKFEYILLTDAIHPEHNKTLRDILTQRGYDLEYSHPYRLSPVMTAHTIGEISLYKRGEQMATIEQWQTAPDFLWRTAPINLQKLNTTLKVLNE